MYIVYCTYIIYNILLYPQYVYHYRIIIAYLHLSWDISAVANFVDESLGVLTKGIRLAVHTFIYYNIKCIARYMAIKNYIIYKN